MAPVLSLLFLLLPALTTALAALCFLWAARDPSRAAGWKVGAGGLGLLLTVGQIFFYATRGWEGDALLPTIQAGVASAAAVLGGLALSAATPAGGKGRRNLRGLLFALGVPAACIAALVVSQSFTPDAIHQRDGRTIARALEQYKTESGTYPPALSALMPRYLTDLKTPPKASGWLYRAENGTYTLGYVSRQDAPYITACFLRPDHQTWDCRAVPEPQFPDWSLSLPFGSDPPSPA